MRQGVVPHPKEDLRFLRIPQQEDEKFQLGTEGQGTSHRRHRPHAIHEDHDPPIQERIPGGHPGQEDDRLRLDCQRII